MQVAVSKLFLLICMFRTQNTHTPRERERERERERTDGRTDRVVTLRCGYDFHVGFMATSSGLLAVANHLDYSGEPTGDGSSTSDTKVGRLRSFTLTHHKTQLETRQHVVEFCVSSHRAHSISH